MARQRSDRRSGSNTHSKGLLPGNGAVGLGRRLYTGHTSEIPIALNTRRHTDRSMMRMHAYQKEKLEEKRAGSLMDELHHIHRELSRLLPIVVKSPKTEEWNALLREQQKEDEQQRQRLVHLAGTMGMKPGTCGCPRAVELLADLLLAHRSLLRKHATGGLVIKALRSVREYTEELWQELSPILAFRASSETVSLADELRGIEHALLAELPAVHRSQLSSGGLRSLKT